MSRTTSEKTAFTTIGAAVVFCAVIVLEIFSMATMFAAYFYSAYLLAWQYSIAVTGLRG